MNGWSFMRILAAAVLAATLVSGGAASAQLAGQKPYTTTAYTVEPFTPTTPIMIQGSGVRLRAAPSAGQTPILSSGSTGLVLNVVGISRQPDWDWYQVVLKSGQRAFIRSDLTSAPLRGGASPAQTAMAVSTPPAVAPVPQPVPAPPLPTLGPAQPIEPPPVQLQTPAQPSAPTSNRGSLDLPKPSDPPGLLSH
jgi:hypothetical protein